MTDSVRQNFCTSSTLKSERSDSQELESLVALKDLKKKKKNQACYITLLLYRKLPQNIAA